VAVGCDLRAVLHRRPHLDLRSTLRTSNPHVVRTIELDPSFYVTSFEGESVQIYPLPVWQEIEERLAKLPSQNPTRKKFIDRTSYFGQLTALDKAGRVLIPALLRDSAKMTGEVAVLGNLTFLDVWNHQLFLSRLNNQAVTNEDKETLSQLGI
jgi:MraZ protein